MLKKIVIAVLGGAVLLAGQTAPPDRIEPGIGFIETAVYSIEDDARILRLYSGLRVADVCDGLDQVGLPNVGRVSPEIQAAWKDIQGLTHQFRGIALTVRFVPSNLPPGPEEGRDFESWRDDFYGSLSSEAFVSIIRPGRVVVIDDVEEADIGSVGSYNILDWASRGAVGVVTDAGARDTDEIVLERVPLYFRGPGRGIRPGRNLLESVNRPVSVGGALVCPGDVVVADGDGVVVVPRRVAEAVASVARGVLESDQEARRQLFEQTGREPDSTLKK